MLKLPTHFDKNEWFVLITMILLFIGFIASPKIFPRGMIMTVLLFFALLGLTVDILVGSEYPIDFYMIMDSPKLELFDMLIYIVNYSIYGYFFSYFIYLWNLNNFKIVGFILLWCGLNTLIEWISVYLNVFTYQNGWNLGYSSMSYVIIFMFCALVVKAFGGIWYVKNIH